MEKKEKKKGPSCMQLCFERSERTCLYFATIPVIIVYIWTVVCMAIYPTIPYCSPDKSIEKDCKVMDQIVEFSTLGVSAVLLVVALVFILFFIFVPGSWSLHGQKNKVLSLALLVFFASSVVQLVMSFLQRGIAVNYAQVDNEQEHFSFANGTVSALVESSYYLNNTKVILSVRDITGKRPAEVSYENFDMSGSITSENITIDPDYPISVDGVLDWDVDGLVDGHTYLFALIPAIQNGGNSTIFLQPQIVNIDESPLKDSLNETACQALGPISDKIKYIDMRLFHPCIWSEQAAICVPVNKERCSFH